LPDFLIWTVVTGKPCGPALALVDVVLVLVDAVPASLPPLLNAPETPRTIITNRTAPLPRATTSWVWRLDKVVRGPRDAAASALGAPSGGCSAACLRRKPSGTGS